MKENVVWDLFRDEAYKSVPRFARGEDACFEGYVGDPYEPGHSQDARSLEKLTHDSVDLTKDDSQKLKQKFAPDRLTATGYLLSRLFEGKTVVDLGCGPRKGAPAIEFLAKMWGKRYVGVDHVGIQNDIVKSTPLAGSRPFRSYYFRRNMFEIAMVDSKLKDQKKAFVLNGIEWSVGHRDAPNALMQEIERLSGKDDVLVLGSGTEGFDPERFGFRKIHQSGYSDSPESWQVRIFQKE